MRISITELRRIIREAVADHVRLPKGPNSRDDAEDRLLNDPFDPDEKREEDRADLLQKTCHGAREV